MASNAQRGLVARPRRAARAALPTRLSVKACFGCCPSRRSVSLPPCSLRRTSAARAAGPCGASTPRPTVSAIEFSRARGFDAGVVTLLVSLRSGQGHPCTEGIERVRLEGRLRFRPSSCKALKSRTSCNPPLGTTCRYCKPYPHGSGLADRLVLAEWFRCLVCCFTSWRRL
jgi:hypothetical protein